MCRRRPRINPPGARLDPSGRVGYRFWTALRGDRVMGDTPKDSADRVRRSSAMAGAQVIACDGDVMAKRAVERAIKGRETTG